MTTARLPSAWRQWAKARARQLVDQGIPRADARTFARDEAEARSEIARLVGIVAAFEAPCVIQRADEGGELRLRFGFDVDPDLIKRGPAQ